MTQRVAFAAAPLCGVHIQGAADGQGLRELPAQRTRGYRDCAMVDARTFRGPVAMPVPWSDLEVYSRADVFSITGAANLAQERTDPWPRHCALHEHMPDARAALDALQAKKVACGSEPYSV